MTLDQIMKLLDAGYTKDEINEFMDLQTSDEPKPAKEPAADPKPAKEPAADPKPAKEPAADPEPKPEPAAQHYPDEISKLTEQVKALTESMQEHFRNSAEEKKTSALNGDNILKNILEKGEI